MAQNWYFARGGQQSGPVPWEQLQQLASSGHIAPSDLVWCDGMPEWSPAGSIPGLTQSVSPAPHPGVAPGAYGAAPVGYAQSGYSADPSALNYYTPPQNVLFAGFWLRFVALFVDCLVLFIPNTLVNVVIKTLTGEDPWAPYRGLGGPNGPNVAFYLRTPADMTVFVITSVIWWLYYALQESGAAQATLGKRAVGIKVTNLTGGRISFGQATGRFFGMGVSYITCCVGFIMAAFTAKKQALHDMMAGTLVIRS